MPKKKIMIVDDDKEFLEEFKEMLNLSGYHTTTFPDGTSALRMVSKVKPDIILLDLRLKGRSGLEVASELKRFPETADIPIIAMTAYYTEKERIKLMNAFGIQSCLMKPFNPLDAIARIEAVFKENGDNP